MQKTIFWMCLVGLFLQWDNVGAFHDDVYQPRVPIELIEELQDIDNPYPATLERNEVGKQIFYGKGLCVTCHSCREYIATMPICVY